jgi:hypothetical protein
MWHVSRLLCQCQSHLSNNDGVLSGYGFVENDVQYIQGKFCSVKRSSNIITMHFVSDVHYSEMHGTHNDFSTWLGWRRKMSFQHLVSLSIINKNAVGTAIYQSDMICDRNAYRKASERKMEWDCLFWRIHAKKMQGHSNLLCQRIVVSIELRNSCLLNR